MRFKSKHVGLEEGLRGSESNDGSFSKHVTKALLNIPLVADSDDLSIRELVALLKGRRLSGGLEFLLKVQSNIAELLFDISDNFTLGGGGEGITALRQVLNQIFSQIATSKIKTEDGVRQSETFVNWDGVGDTISRIQDDTCCST